MSQFPDFMRMDLTKLTCSGCGLLLCSFLVAFGSAVGVGVLVTWLLPALFTGGRSDRWLMGIFLVVGLVVGAGFFQLGRFALRRLGLRMYREGHAPPDDQN